MCRIWAISLGFVLLANFVAMAEETKAKPKSTILTLADLYLTGGPRWPALSPNGNQLAYSKYWIDPATRLERYALWIAQGSRDKVINLEPEQPDARRPVFSPDGKWIVFLSTRPRPRGWRATLPVPPESDAAVDIWLISSTGGKALPLAGPDKPYGRVFHDGFFGRVCFSPDGKRLAFIADDGKPVRTKEDESNDVIVVRPDGGEGLTGWGNGQVYVADLEPNPGSWAARKVARLTNDDVWYGDPQWSPDGKTLVVVANKTNDREAVRYSINKNYDLWAIDVATKAVRQLTTGPGPDVSPRFSPDGKTLAYLSVPRKGSHRDVFNLCLLSLETKTPEVRVVADHHAADAGKSGHLSPTYPLPEMPWDGPNHLVFSSGEGVHARTARIDLATGQTERVNADTKVGLAGKRFNRLAELSPPDEPWLKDRSLGAARAVTWESSDGLKIEGLLTVPPTEVAKAPYKLLVIPHGGPHGRVAFGFDFTVQLFAANGYAVFQPNFRGSTGYGQKFIDADRRDFGGGDMQDILTGIEQLVKEGLVDRDRQFVFGSSYGGFMTTWLVGHTNQFRAACAQNAVTDLPMMWSLSDIPSWIEWEFGGRGFEINDLLRKHSPLTYVDKVKTPTLLLHCRDDRRVPLPQGRAFHRALQVRGVPTELVIYPDENHGIRQPRHREDFLRRILAWFARHDKKASP